MKKALVAVGLFFGAIIVLAVIVFIAIISLKNKLVIAEEDVNNKWANVETQYQRRYDLIPNLVESVKGYMNQEQEIFDEIAEARTRYAGTTSGSQDRVDAANDLESSLGRLLVIMENYPELQSDSLVTSLMEELEGTENRIAVERNRYNDEVNSFNKMIRVFPNSLINDLFLHFELKTRFEAVEGAETAPQVDLTFDNDDESTESDEE